jgi:hypothetical protein
MQSPSISLMGMKRLRRFGSYIASFPMPILC